MARRLLALRFVLGCTLPLLGCIIVDDTGDDAAETSGADTGLVDGTGAATGAADCFEPPRCDPLSPGCVGTDKCVPDGSAFSCVAVAPGTLEAGVGEACSGVSSCAPGSVCSPTGVPGCVGAEGCCAALCELSEPQCPAGTTCSPYASPGSSLCYGDVGVCVAGG